MTLLMTLALVIAAVGTCALWHALHDHRRTARRAAWFERIQWALALTSSDDPQHAAMGRAMLPELLDQAEDEDRHYAGSLREYTEVTADNHADRMRELRYRGAMRTLEVIDRKFPHLRKKSAKSD